jgi:hypothetical protein
MGPEQNRAQSAQTILLARSVITLDSANPRADAVAVRDVTPTCSLRERASASSR